MLIKVSDYPQLRSICWSRRTDELITPQEALALYERNWDYVDKANLTQVEIDLIESLRVTVGNGVLNV